MDFLYSLGLTSDISSIMFFSGAAALMVLVVWFLLRYILIDDGFDLEVEEIKSKPFVDLTKEEMFALDQYDKMESISQISNKLRFDFIVFTSLVFGMWFAIAMLYFTNYDRDSLTILIVMTLVSLFLVFYRASSSLHQMSMVTKVRKWAEMRAYDGAEYDKEGKEVQRELSVDQAIESYLDSAANSTKQSIKPTSEDDI